MIFKVRRQILLGVLALFLLLLVFIVASKFLYVKTTDILTDNLRERILAISITTAALIDSDDLSKLQKESDWQSPEWRRIVTKLHQVKYSHDDIVFMYIYRKKADDNNKMEFVADADSINPYVNLGSDPSKFVDVNRDNLLEPDGPDKLQWPGQDYEEATDIPETFQAYHKPLTSADIYTDAYGSVITGYAPIVDDNGQTVAVLATDIKADDFLTITRRTLTPFLYFIILLASIILVFGIMLLYSSLNEIKAREEIENLAHVIDKSNQELKRLDEAKSDFVSIASHQLRTPLTVIKGYMSMISEGSFGRVPAKLKLPIEKAFASSERLEDLVENLLSVSRIERGTMKYKFTPTDFGALSKSVIDELVPTAKSKKISLTIDIENKLPEVNMDQEKIRQVMINIVDNAIKYTQVGHVKVKVFTNLKNPIAQTDKPSVVFSVTDSGDGVPLDVQGELFQKFVRGQNETHIKGTGLGLYVGRMMIEAHQGKIWVESDGVSHGATFAFAVPIAHT